MAETIRQLGANDVALMHDLLTCFGEAFDDHESYANHRPSAGYLQQLLERHSFVALAALGEGKVVGGLAAYELVKFEQERSEFYLYDLAVDAAYRRRGIATALIDALKTIASDRGAYVIFVQADTGVEDAAAIALYTELGAREDVLHFDIAVDPQR